MATQTYEQLIAGANKIKENELPESNTHDLVGEQLLQMTNKMQEESSNTTKAFTDLETDRVKKTTELNISNLYKTQGIDGTNRYTLEGAIAQVEEKYRKAGLKVTFVNESNNTETWEYKGVSWAVGHFSEIGSNKFSELDKKFIEYSLNNKSGMNDFYIPFVEGQTFRVICDTPGVGLYISTGTNHKQIGTFSEAIKFIDYTITQQDAATYNRVRTNYSSQHASTILYGSIFNELIANISLSENNKASVSNLNLIAKSLLSEDTVYFSEGDFSAITDKTSDGGWGYQITTDMQMIGLIIKAYKKHVSVWLNDEVIYENLNFPIDEPTEIIFPKTSINVGDRLYIDGLYYTRTISPYKFGSKTTGSYGDGGYLSYYIISGGFNKEIDNTELLDRIELLEYENSQLKESITLTECFKLNESNYAKATSVLGGANPWNYVDNDANDYIATEIWVKPVNTTVQVYRNTELQKEFNNLVVNEWQKLEVSIAIKAGDSLGFKGLYYSRESLPEGYSFTDGTQIIVGALTVYFTKVYSKKTTSPFSIANNKALIKEWNVNDSADGIITEGFSQVENGLQLSTSSTYLESEYMSIQDNSIDLIVSKDSVFKLEMSKGFNGCIISFAENKVTDIKGVEAEYDIEEGFLEEGTNNITVRFIENNSELHLQLTNKKLSKILNYTLTGAYYVGVRRLVITGISGTMPIITRYRVYYPTDLDIIFIGDSITQGNNTDVSYAMLFMEKTGLKCATYALGGSKLKFGVSFAQKYGSLRPKLVSAMFGMNTGNSIPLFKALKAALDIYSVPLIVQHMPLRREGSDPTSISQIYYENVAIIQEFISEYADIKESARFDIATGKNGSLEEYYTSGSDGIHPGTEQHVLMCNRMFIDTPIMASFPSNMGYLD